MVHETTTNTDIGDKYRSIHLLGSNFPPYIIIFELTSLKEVIPFDFTMTKDFFLDLLNSLNFGI